MADGICLYGSRKKSGAPDSFSLETGVLCSLFGVTSPGCKAADTILPSLFPGISLPGKIGKAVVDLYEVVSILPDGFIPTAEFCAHPPIFPESVPNWADVILAFSGVYPDALVEKMATAFAYQKWFEYCECQPRPPLDPAPPDSPDPPLFIPPPPSGACQAQFQRIQQQYQSQLTLLEGNYATWREQYPEGVLGFRGIWDDARLTAFGLYRVDLGDSPPYFEIAPQDGEQTDCACRYRVTSALVIYTATDNPPGVPDFSGNAPTSIRWIEVCPQPLTPDPLPDPSLPEDVLVEFCELLPDVPGCEPCETSCEEESIVVQVFDDCQSSSPFVAALFSCDSPSPPSDCAEALANVQSTVDLMTLFLCSGGLESFLAAKGGEIEGVKAGNPGCEEEIDSYVLAQWPLLCLPDVDCGEAYQFVLSSLNSLSLVPDCVAGVDAFFEDPVVAELRTGAYSSYPSCNASVNQAVSDYYSAACP